MPGADAEPIPGTGDLERFDQVVEVRKRFPHSHDNDVRQPLPRGKQVAQANQLLNDFADSKIALEAAQATRAEYTAHAATYLGADAGGVALGLPKDDTFDQL